MSVTLPASVRKSGTRLQALNTYFSAWTLRRLTAVFFFTRLVPPFPILGPEPGPCLLQHAVAGHDLTGQGSSPLPLALTNCDQRDSERVLLCSPCPRAPPPSPGHHQPSSERGRRWQTNKSRLNAEGDLHNPWSHPDYEARLQSPAAGCFRECVPLAAHSMARVEWHVPLSVHRVPSLYWMYPEHACLDATRSSTLQQPVEVLEPGAGYQTSSLPEAAEQAGHDGRQQSKQFFILHSRLAACFHCLTLSPLSVPFKAPHPLFVGLAPTASSCSHSLVSAPIRPLCHQRRPAAGLPTHC